ncbi:MAG: M48 family metalloprotease, partial [Myxococcales bacterium]|nr:M48 family metalloprotease [Myxococcales bacterium]
MSRQRRRIWGKTQWIASRALCAFALCALILAAGCARSPRPSPEEGRKRPENLILSSEHADEKAGEEGSKRVEVEMGLVDDPKLVAYLDSLGQRIAVHAIQRTFDYQFRIVDQDVPNAFALPGGYIYISRGLLALAGSEDELANVIGHEITHVAARHAAGRQVIAQRGNLLGLPGAVVGAVLGEKAGKRVANSITYTNPAYIAAYSRDQERAADRMGQKITARAGYDPAAMVTFLKRLTSTER